MYQDPTLLRKHVVKIRLSDAEADIVNAITNYTGEQKATLLRELILERAAEILSPSTRTNEAALSALIGPQRATA
jgi:hypothetical protein